MRLPHEGKYLPDLPRLVREHAQELQGLGMQGLAFQDLAVERHGLEEIAGTMLTDRGVEEPPGGLALVAGAHARS